MELKCWFEAAAWQEKSFPEAPIDLSGDSDPPTQCRVWRSKNKGGQEITAPPPSPSSCRPSDSCGSGRAGGESGHHLGGGHGEVTPPFWPPVGVFKCCSHSEGL